MDKTWKLIAGPCDDPSERRQACIIETSLFMAGFPHQMVWLVDDLPECFSRPLAHCALWMNDNMPDDIRQELMKFVMRLPGSADDDAVEFGRNAAIQWRLAERIGLERWEYAYVKYAEAASYQPELWRDAIKIFESVLATGKQAVPLECVA